MGIENLNSPPLPSPPLNLQEAHSEIVFGGKGMEFRADNETKVKRRDEIETASHETRREETRDGLVDLISRQKFSRRDEILDQVNRE